MREIKGRSALDRAGQLAEGPVLAVHARQVCLWDFLSLHLICMLLMYLVCSGWKAA